MWHTSLITAGLLLASISCFTYLYRKTKYFERDSALTILLLSVLSIAGLLPLLWQSPMHMAAFHFGMVVVAYGSYRLEEGVKVMGGIVLMLGCDVAWMLIPGYFPSNNWAAFPADIFWWQSLLNVILWTMFGFSLVGCYSRYSHYLQDGRYSQHGQDSSQYRPLSESFITAGERGSSH